jgi:hypothetical protein
MIREVFTGTLGRIRNVIVLLAPVWCTASLGDEGFGLVLDRTAIERVYYNHRLGTKPPFEQALPPSLVESLVKRDIRKEAALRDIYGVEIDSAALDTEVQRINTTTRAPEMLAEIKAALDNDPVRFAHAFAKPFLVERLLRERFEKDSTLHMAPRREMETVRNRMPAARRKGASVPELQGFLEEGRADEVSELTWILGARPPDSTTRNSPEELEIMQRFGSDTKIL